MRDTAPSVALALAPASSGRLAAGVRVGSAAAAAAADLAPASSSADSSAAVASSAAAAAPVKVNGLFANGPVGVTRAEQRARLSEEHGCPLCKKN
eukprot:scaffold100871_cov33-Phaeocystis_antarctica.AAC.1